MSDTMSTPYLLTLMGDRIEEIIKMVQQLKKQDPKYNKWNGYDADMTVMRLKWLKSVAENRKKMFGQEA